VVSPDPLTFGGTRPALVALAPRTLQVRNAATIPVTVSSVSILTGPRFTPGDFAVIASTCATRQLASGETCTIDVRSTPQLPGSRSGVLAISTADPAYTRLVPLSGQALPPVLAVNPAVVRTNRVTMVTGSNFPPGRTVTVTLATPGSRILGTATAGADGRFATPLLVFPQTSAGSWPMVAIVDGTAIQAQGNVLVVPGSFQPPDFTSRR
jgi:hypothetical protein